MEKWSRTENYIFQSYISPIQTVPGSSQHRKARDFNPTLVQFKPSFNNSLFSLQHLFQSYISPIQTALSASTVSWSSDFNPTLVQFKRSALAESRSSVTHFNPTLVQFKQRPFLPLSTTEGTQEHHTIPLCRGSPITYSLYNDPRRPAGLSAPPIRPAQSPDDSETPGHLN